MTVGNNPGIRIPSIGECHDGVRTSIRQMVRLFGYDSNPTFASLTLASLIATRLIYSDATSTLTSVSNLASWVAGTNNEIDITDDGDGTITVGLVNPLIVAKGGTGLATLTDHGILLGSGTDAVTPLGVATNGQLPIGSTGADPVLATLTEGEGIDVTNAIGSITIAGEDASATNKGIASFNAANFSVVAGVVSLISGGGLTHNTLGGLQGGTTDEYYHLTNTEHSYVSGINAQSVLITANPTYVGLNITSVGALPSPIVVGKIIRLSTNDSLYLGRKH